MRLSPSRCTVSHGCMTKSTQRVESKTGTVPYLRHRPRISDALFCRPIDTKGGRCRRTTTPRTSHRTHKPQAHAGKSARALGTLSFLTLYESLRPVRHWPQSLLPWKPYSICCLDGIALPIHGRGVLKGTRLGLPGQRRSSGRLALFVEAAHDGESAAKFFR